MHVCIATSCGFCVNLFELGLFPKTVRENLGLSGIPDEELVLKFG